MKGLIKTIIVAGVSFAAGYVTCRYAQESYYLEVANRKLQEQDEEHADCTKKLEKQIEDLQVLLTDRHLGLVSEIASQQKPVEVEPDTSREELARAEIALTSYQGEPAQLVDYTQFSGKTAASNVIANSPRLPRHGEPLLPRLIEETEFLEAPNSYTFTLYVGDNTLVNESDEPIAAGVRSTITGHLDSALLQNINPEGNVFLYNPEGNYAAQISISMGSYSSEVGG